ncbi:MAG: hypothetical protein ACKPJO_07105, partial [Dolichospermum sp.]
PYTGATNDVDLGNFSLNAKSLHVKGTAGQGHLALKHQSANATASSSETAVYADLNGDLKWKNSNLFNSTLKTSTNTADRVYTFPNRTGNLADDTDLATKENVIIAGTTSQYFRGDKTFQTLDKTAVGLSNVDNTSDATKNSSTTNLTNKTQVSTVKQTLTPTGTTQTIDWNNGSIVDLSLASASGNVTFTFSNPQVATTYLIEVTQGATARNLIFPVGTLQSGGGGVTYTSTANRKDIIAILWDGTQYLISVSRNYS